MPNTELSYEKLIRLKCSLLVDGCNIESNIFKNENFHKKEIHLYSHSPFKTEEYIPDDLILKNLRDEVIVRLRYNPNSKYKIIKINKDFYLQENHNEEKYPISFLDPMLIEKEEQDLNLDKVASFLGKDLIGVIPSNYCFYFSDNNECKFCEIWTTFKKEINFPKSLKNPNLIKLTVEKALNNNNIRHLAITSGNVHTYDYTAIMFSKIGNELLKIENFEKLDHILATLMPPEDFSLIKKIKDSGFNKIYFPLEIFNKNLFEVICPGKFSFGYEKIIDALKYSIELFGVGNVYTNLVYGIQSLNKDLNCSDFDLNLENKISLEAVEFLLNLKIIPVFTIYHYGGYNKIGNVPLSSSKLFDFFKELGNLIYNSKLLDNRETIIFGPLSLSNTVYNEFYMNMFNNRRNFL